MEYNWHLSETETGILTWIGTPFCGRDGIVKVNTYVQTETQCYYSSHALSALPYLALGGVCCQGEAPQSVLNEMRSPSFTIQELASWCEVGAVSRILEESWPRLVHRIKTQEYCDSGVYFEHQGIRYVMPHSVVLASFLGNMSPIINGALHEGIFDEWVINEVIDKHGGIEVNFSDKLAAKFLSSPETVGHLVWLRYTPSMYNWWKSIAVSYYKKEFEVPFPRLQDGQVTFWGDCRQNCFLVYRMEISGVRVPFPYITWTHPRVKKVALNDLPYRAVSCGGSNDAEKPENDTTAFARQGVPYIDRVSNSTVIFENPPMVQKKRSGDSDGHTKKRRLPAEEASEKASTNEIAVGGRFLPMNTVPEMELELESEIHFSDEFALFGQALLQIPNLQISGIAYSDLNECRWAVVNVTYGGHEMTLVEGRKDRRPCASTMIWGAKHIPLSSLLNGGSWDKKQIEQYCKQENIKSVLLRHAGDRTKWHWGALLREKIDCCV